MAFWSLIASPSSTKQLASTTCLAVVKLQNSLSDITCDTCQFSHAVKRLSYIILIASQREIRLACITKSSSFSEMLVCPACIFRLVELKLVRLAYMSRLDNFQFTPTCSPMHILLLYVHCSFHFTHFFECTHNELP